MPEGGHYRNISQRQFETLHDAELKSSGTDLGHSLGQFIKDVQDKRPVPRGFLTEGGLHLHHVHLRRLEPGREPGNNWTILKGKAGAHSGESEYFPAGTPKDPAQNFRKVISEEGRGEFKHDRGVIVNKEGTKTEFVSCASPECLSPFMENPMAGVANFGPHWAPPPSPPMN